MITIEELRRLLSYNPETGVFTWKVRPSMNTQAGSEAGNFNNKGRRMIQIKGRLYGAHRLAWFYVTGEWPSDQIDHENGNKTDNRFANLREANNSQNAINQRTRSTNTSGQKGVHWMNKYGKWNARISAEKKRFNLGYFDKFEDAVAAYKSAATKLHGEFARRE